MLLPRDTTREQAIQKPVRLLLYFAETFRTETGRQRIPPDLHQCAGQIGAAIGATDHRCERPHRGGYLYRQFHLWI